MVAALLLLLSSQVPPAPVRVWLDQARVYVQTSTDGHLIVLHARPDGRVEVLFPEDPARDPFVRAGTYEIPTPMSSGPAGRGMVVAAVSPDPIWFDEFMHRSEWDIASLTGSGAGDDPEAVLTDIVQRMLGDGSFNYDVVTYSVAPRPVAIVDAVDTTPQPPSIDLVVSDLPLRQFPHRHRRRAAAPVAPAATPPLPVPAAIAVYSVHQPSVLEPLPLRVSRPSMPRSQLLTRFVHVTRSGDAALVPTTAPARSWTPAVSAPATAAAAPASAPAPVVASEPRVVARPETRVGVARARTAETAEAAPAPARAGSAAGVGLGQVHTAGWHH